MSDPRHWCTPLQPSNEWIERFATACRNYIMEQLQQKHVEIGYRIMVSNVFNYLINQLDTENPHFRYDMRELRNAMTAALAIIDSPAF
jgi:hypothetical protein